jgi:serine/threonine-protein kinase
MAPIFSHGDGLTDRFKREARTAASLSHPNIIPIYSVREGQGLVYFVMKLVRGTTLDQVIAELRQLPIPMVEALLGQVGSALGYAHRNGVVHRDVKPGNVMIDEEGWAVVTDFGIAKVDQAEALTMTGMAVGTPLYMSPEQCVGGTITGRPPYPGTGMMSIMFSHCNDPIPPIAPLRPDCPLPLQLAVERMLAKDPAARWPNVEEAVAAIGLRALAHDDPTRTHLVALARTGSGNRIVAKVQTPRSPVPRRSDADSDQSRKRTPRLAGWLKAFGLIVAGAVIAFAATRLGRGADEVAPAGAVSPPPAPLAVPPASVALTPPPAQPPPPPPPPAAINAGDRSARPRPGPAVVPPPPAAAAQPAVVESRAPDSTAQRPAESLLAGAVPRVRTSDPAPPPRVPPQLGGDPIAERATIEALVASYARALSAGDLASAVRLYPGLSRNERETYEGFWKSGGAMRARWSVSELEIAGTSVSRGGLQPTITWTTGLELNF